MKKLILVTGPQGSGNHQWAKIFNKVDYALSWPELAGTFWVGHGQNPFFNCWSDPLALQQLTNLNYRYFFVSISCPYAVNREHFTPDFKNFISVARTFFNVKIAVLGRDKTVLTHQQSRVRPTVTLESSLLPLLALNPDCFLSHELLCLYKEAYVNSILAQLEILEKVSAVDIDDIIQNSNEKYFTQCDPQPLDIQVASASGYA